MVAGNSTAYTRNAWYLLHLAVVTAPWIESAVMQGAMRPDGPFEESGLGLKSTLNPAQRLPCA